MDDLPPQSSVLSYISPVLIFHFCFRHVPLDAIKPVSQKAFHLQLLPKTWLVAVGMWLAVVKEIIFYKLVFSGEDDAICCGLTTLYTAGQDLLPLRWTLSTTKDVVLLSTLSTTEDIVHREARGFTITKHLCL